MGLLKLLLISFLPVTGAAAFVSLRLGAELPRVTRATGRRVGMLYNYLKVVLKIITPKSYNSVEVVRKMRQSGQQAFALTNEMKWNLFALKPEVKRILPDLTQDPIGLQSLVKHQEEPKDKAVELLSGTNILKGVFEERRKIVQAKQEKKQAQDAYMRL